MNKKDWEVALKALQGLYLTATDNVNKATVQREELAFNITNYKKKIAEFK